MNAPMTSGLRLTIRVYKQGLGDAFLLGFHTANDSARWVLIDCGVVGRQDAPIYMQAVAADIAHTTSDTAHPDGHLHCIVVSNLRWDHVSGFVQAAPIFHKMAVDEIWLPATEDPGNEQAHRRAGETQQRLQALRRVVPGLSAPAPDLARRLTRVLSLFGDHHDATANGATAPEASAAALAILRSLEQTGTRLRYLDVRIAPQRLFSDLPMVRVYVLGPQAEGNTPGRRHQLAAEQGALDLAGTFLAAAQKTLGLTAAEESQWKELLERNLPFTPNQQITVATQTVDGQESSIFQPSTHARFFATRYFAASESWRRIDYDWLGVAQSLALTLDHSANNASLMLAFELVDSERVLLFPGDAQLGAWHAWDALSWTMRDGGQERHVTAHDLLRRTVVYKVAHHCSQTGTLLAGGLERMERGDLVALLPVSRAAARELGWDLPYAPLLQRLRNKTRGRVLITDPEESPLAARRKPDDLTEADWRKFQQAVCETSLYTQYTLNV